jgi:hypothetical protein
MENIKNTDFKVKDELVLKQLAHLKEKLYSGDISRARRAAHNLSWMQEDGFEILKDAILDRLSGRATKTAAGYGLRRVRGRMKKMAMDTLTQGLLSTSSLTREICGRVLLMMTSESQPKPVRPQRYGNRFNVKETFPKSRPGFSQKSNLQIAK